MAAVWIPLPGEEEFADTVTDAICVVSWNILGDGEGLALSDKHAYCSRELRIWRADEDGLEHCCQPDRLERTALKLVELGAHVYCLQECLPAMFRDLAARLDALYTGFHSCDHLTTLAAEVGDDGEEGSKVKRGEFGNAMFVRKGFLSDWSVKWVKSGLFEDFVREGRLTGKVRKRLLSLEDGFMMLKLTRNPSERWLEGGLDHGCREGCAERRPDAVPEAGQGQSANSDLLVVGAHLYFDPHYPHVKALQAEILTHVACFGASEQSAVFEDHPEAASVVVEKDEQEDELLGGKEPEEKPAAKPPIVRELEPCSVVICGDFNSVPHFQPWFLPTYEELASLVAISRLGKEGAMEEDATVDEAEFNEECLNVHQLPASYQQSGVYRLMTEGALEPDHPEHPDTFGRGRADPQAKKMHRCGPLLVPDFNGLDVESFFQSAAPSRRSGAGRLTRAYRGALFPARTTLVQDFEGVLDYIFFAQRGSGKLRQLGVLQVPELHAPIPDAVHTSDHLPVGVSFQVLVDQ